MMTPKYLLELCKLSKASANYAQLLPLVVPREELALYVNLPIATLRVLDDAGDYNANVVLPVLESLSESLRRNHACY